MGVSHICIQSTVDANFSDVELYNNIITDDILSFQEIYLVKQPSYVVLDIGII